MTEENYNAVEEVQKTEGKDLSFFFPENNTESAIEEVVLSKRFKDKKGNIIPFKMKAITQTEVERIRKDCTERKKVRGQGTVKEVNMEKMYEQVALNSTVYPDFRSKELLDAYGEYDSIAVAKRVLHVPGEYATWIQKTLEINELDEDYSEIEDDIKN